jgi:triosephosphate isomerase
LQAKIATPIIIVNFKTYSEAAAERAIDLAKKAEKVGQETGVCIGLAPQVADIYRVAKAVKLPVFAQHVDPITAGNCTGQVLAQSISKAGAIGMLINHSERQLKLSEIDELVDLAKKQKLVSCVCTNNPRVSAAVASLGPDIIAVVPRTLSAPELPFPKPSLK